VKEVGSGVQLKTLTPEPLNSPDEVFAMSLPAFRGQGNVRRLKPFAVPSEPPAGPTRPDPDENSPACPAYRGPRLWHAGPLRRSRLVLVCVEGPAPFVPTRRSR
jgi:hypothetical protein